MFAITRHFTKQRDDRGSTVFQLGCSLQQLLPRASLAGENFRHLCKGRLGIHATALVRDEKIVNLLPDNRADIHTRDTYR